MMNIIHVTQFLGIGGLEKIIYHLALEQQARGHRVKVYVYDYEQTWVDYFRKSGLEVITPEVKKNGYDISLLKRMNQDLFSFDIIHTHDLNPMMYLAPIMLWKKITFKKTPRLIHTTHGLDHIKKNKKIKWYENIVSRMTNRLVAVSEKIGDFYLKTLKMPLEKISIIPNGIALYKGEISEELRLEKRQWICQKHSLDPSRPILLSLSRITPLKDQKFLIECLNLRPGYQLLIAGPASDRLYYDELKNLETKNIFLIGAQEAVNDYNIGCDLYLSASTHEGIPVAVLEALAVETPCLISDIAGHLTLNQYGHLIDSYKIHDQFDFLEKCDEIVKNISLTKKRCKNSRTIVEKQYSVSTMVNHYLEVYQS